jgi:nucleoside-diphosphate-sugar epimerase
VNPRKLDHIYNISKIAGEAVCHAMNNSKVRVVRLSNVYGYDAKSENFVFSLIKDAIKGSVVLNSSLSSCKDYISIDNTINALIRIAQRGQHQIYNVASGHNITAGQILNKLKELTNCTIEVKGIDTIRFPKINITRLLREFPFEPDNLLNDLERLVKIYKIKAGVKV